MTGKGVIVSSIQGCSHEIVHVGACIACGKMFPTIDVDDGSTPKGNGMRVPKKSIIKELERLRLPEKVLNEADRIFVKIKPATTKGNRRWELLFYCVYCAYQDLGIAVDPNFIAKDLGMPKESIPKAINTFSAYAGYKPVSRIYLPTSLIRSYADKLNLSNVDEIISLGEMICRKTDDFNEDYPQKFSAGIVLFYLSLNCCSIDKRILAEKLCTTEATLNSTYQTIARVYNGH